MVIKFRTNIDAYRMVDWPRISIVPRKGEYVNVHPSSESYCILNHIPSRLEVVSVTYYQDAVLVELWYNETDYKLYTSAGYKLL
jgi:hypothetical protein